MAPTGFRPDMFYPSRNHPRTLQLALFALSDCWLSSGLQWHHIKHHIAPNQVAVFAGSSIGQMDESGFGGMLKSALLGKRTTSKQLPLGYPQMPADFSNAYVLGSLGRSGASMGACASFLYNLHNAVDGIQEGRYKVAIVGGADCPITPEVIEGFRAMGALAEDQGLRELDGLGDTDTPNYRRTSRPFGLNCGFTMGESSQYVILMDDQLALELGATIYGSVPTVASHADGGKRSISAPGAGNYLTLAQAAASIRDLLGQDVLAHETLVQAHGTSTPQNRVTESDVLSRVAQTFGIDQWMVSAVKSQLGHSQGTAGGDQLAVSLGAFASQIAPGIQTTETLAPDVIQQGLDFVLQSREQTLSAALINAKGFGGNNATAAVLSPEATATLLQSRHGPIQIAGSDEVRARQERYRHEIDRGTIEILYHYGENIVDGSDLEMTATSVSVPGFGHSMPLDQAKTKYSDLIKS
jgi:acetoacetyl-[acyl-carrier protein] synthase